MRLIDRQTFFLKQMQKSRVYDTDRQIGYWAGVDDTLYDMNHEPYIDAAPVVRCRDCVHFHISTDTAGQTERWCAHHDGLHDVSNNDFCSYGRKKTI